MTREEEIQNYAYNNCIAEDIDDTSYCLIVDAIKWADETMLDRACEWLKKNIDLYAYESSNTHYPEIKLTECFEEAFRQAMEGE